MAFSYRPEDALECLKEGEYDAVLHGVTEKTSKAGNPMLVAEWEVYDESNRKPILKDYVVNPQTLFRLKQIARAMGKIADFEAGRFDLQEHVGTRIKLKLKVEEQAGFPDQNKIHAYLGVNGNGKTAAPTTRHDDPDESIPF